MIKILIMFLALVLIWFGLTVLEELYWRYIKKAKVVRVVIPAQTYLRLKRNAKMFGVKLDDYVHDNVAQFLLDLSIEDIE